MKAAIVNFFKTYPWVGLLILIIPTYISLVRPGYFPMQDDLQAFRVHQMNECFKDLQIPCRWVPDPGYQYGYPQFIYYPPSVYYIAEIFHLIGFQIIDSVKIVFILGFILSSLTMYILLKSLFGSWPAVVGALIYAYTPYKAVDVYVRGALSEFWSFVFYPLIFWSSYRLIKTQKTIYLVWLSLSVGLLLLTHNLMSMVFLPIALIWCLTWLLTEKKLAVIPKLFLGGLLGLGLAAFFTLPVIIEKQYVHLETLIGGYFDWRQHYVDIYQLFLSNHFGYGSSELGPGDNLSMSAGQIQSVLAVISLIIVGWNFRRTKQPNIIMGLLFFVNLFILFMIHMKSTFIWDRLPMLQFLQFPWRLLTISVFLTSILSAAVFYYIKDKVKSAALGVLIISLMFIIYGSFFKPLRWIDLSDQEKFSGNLWEKQLTISIFDYLPIYAKLPPIHKAPNLPEVLEGQANFLYYKKGSNYPSGEVVAQTDSLLRLPLFDFPGMEVTVDDKKVDHWHDDCRRQEFCLGLITYVIPAGQHTIAVELKKTPIRFYSDLISLASWIILIGLISLSFKGFYKNKRLKYPQ